MVMVFIVAIGKTAAEGWHLEPAPVPAYELCTAGVSAAANAAANFGNWACRPLPSPFLVVLLAAAAAVAAMETQQLPEILTATREFGNRNLAAAVDP